MEVEPVNPDDPHQALGPLQSRVYLLVAHRRALRAMIGAAAARLALDGSVRILDGGNLYDAHATARQVRREANNLRGSSPDLGKQALERILIARAFTCYQMEALLAAQIVVPVPVLILDLLATFSDENAPLAHRNYLMEQIQGHLARLAKPAPVLVGVSPADEPPLDMYLGWLVGQAYRTLRYAPPRPPGQMPLF